MYVEQRTLGEMDGWFSKVFGGNPVKRLFKNVVAKPAKQFVKANVSLAKAAIKYNPITLSTQLATKAIGKAFPMPSGPVNVPVSSPSGPVSVSADPYVNQMAPGYQTYPASYSSDYYPAPALPPQAGTYLNPDMQPFDPASAGMNVAPQDGSQPAPASDGNATRNALLLGAAGLAAWMIFKGKRNAR